MSLLKFKSTAEHMVLCMVFQIKVKFKRPTEPPVVSSVLYTDATSITYIFKIMQGSLASDSYETKNALLTMGEKE